MYIYIYILIGLVSRVFANAPGDWGSIPSQVIPKTQNMVLDAALLSTQIKEQVGQYIYIYQQEISEEKGQVIH